MAILNEQQKNRAIEVMNEYINASPGVDGMTPVQGTANLEKERVKVIGEELQPLLSKYLTGEIRLDEFKSSVDSISKSHLCWGFKGIKGMMFFNMVFNVAEGDDECDQELKTALALPGNELIASSRIKTFVSYIKRLGNQWTDAGNSRYGCPRITSIPFFLSYFWQIQNHDIWPVYYTNSVNTMNDLNLLQLSGDMAKDYLLFKQIHEELIKLFSKKSGKKFNLYKVEQVF
jgi:hypothetical protein